MAHKFKPGDIVQLKSGGPPMTVATKASPRSGEAEAYWCEWFKGASKESAHFHEETLKPYDAPTKA
jgi:uncharacterized protein YodC (DUF2158 family)